MIGSKNQTMLQFLRILRFKLQLNFPKIFNRTFAKDLWLRKFFLQFPINHALFPYAKHTIGLGLKITSA